LRKLIFLTTTLSLLLIAHTDSSSAKASTGTDLRQAYKPVAVMTNQGQTWMRARINNLAPTDQTRLVCVEAYRVGSKRQYHLGCTQLAFGAHLSGNWGVEFNAPVYWLKLAGTYRVVYNYQDAQGDWHNIKSMWLSNLDGRYRTW